MQQTMSILLITTLLGGAAVEAATIAYNNDYAIGNADSINLDETQDWHLRGNNSIFAQKQHSKIFWADGTDNSTGGAFHTFTWGDESGTIKNPDHSAPCNTPDGSALNFPTGALPKNPTTLPTEYGAHYTYTIIAGDTDLKTVTIYGKDRRADQVWLSAKLTDSKGITVRQTLDPVLLTKWNRDTTPHSFSLSFQADEPTDTLTLTVSAYTDDNGGTRAQSKINGRSLGICGITVNSEASPIQLTQPTQPTQTAQPAMISLVGITGILLLLFRRQA